MIGFPRRCNMTSDYDGVLRDISERSGSTANSTPLTSLAIGLGKVSEYRMKRTFSEASIYASIYGVKLPNSDYQPAAVIALLETKHSMHSSKARVHKTLMDFLCISRVSVSVIMASALRHDIISEGEGNNGRYYCLSSNQQDKLRRVEIEIERLTIFNPSQK
jgi:hypothetical protein